MMLECDALGIKWTAPAAQLQALSAVLLLSVLLFLFFVVERNRFQVLGLKDLAAAQAPDVIDSVAAIENFGSLVLADLHSEGKTYSRMQ